MPPLDPEKETTQDTTATTEESTSKPVGDKFAESDINLGEMPDMPEDDLTSGFRATMKAVQAGERDSAKLQQITSGEDKTQPDASKQEKPAEQEPEKKEEAATKPAEAPIADAGETKPPAEEKTATPSADITEAELKVLPSREQKRIKLFIEKTKLAEEKELKALARAEAAEKEAAELREKTSKLPDDVQAKLDELTKFRRRFQLETDPEVQTKFTKRIADGEKVILDAVKTTPLYGPWLEGKIQAAGSFSAFVKAKTEYTIKGQNGNEVVTGADIYKRLLETMPVTEADVLRTTLADQARIAKEKERFIEEETAKAREHFDTVEKQQLERSSKWNAKIKATEEGAKILIKEAFTKLDWLKDVEIKQDATADEKKQATEEQAFRKDMRENLELILKNPVVLNAAAMIDDPKAANDFRDLILDANRVIHVDRELARAKSRISELEADLKKARGVSTTSTTGVIPRTAPSTTEKNGVPARLPGESDLRYSMRTGREAPNDE